MLRDNYIIPNELYQEALDYAIASRAYTSNRHDFHEGGLDNKQKKMFEGKLGEKAFKIFLQDNDFSFIEDESSPRERDKYDFVLNKTGFQKLLIDVKTRTKHYHIRTLELVEQYSAFPKDIYISARLYEGTRNVKLLGWYTANEMLNINRVENNGYLDNYVMYDNELHPMEDFLEKYFYYKKS